MKSLNKRDRKKTRKKLIAKEEARRSKVWVNKFYNYLGSKAFEDNMKAVKRMERLYELREKNDARLAREAKKKKKKKR